MEIIILVVAVVASFVTGKSVGRAQLKKNINKLTVRDMLVHKRQDLKNL
jgi:hypothetical protein|tara:strand:+ start:5355 stop:5501 length:147 start_codon:yes stop_codon:yes gene_type:complete